MLIHVRLKTVDLGIFLNKVLFLNECLVLASQRASHSKFSVTQHAQQMPVSPVNVSQDDFPRLQSIAEWNVKLNQPRGRRCDWN